MLHHIRSLDEADHEDRRDGGFTLIELLVVIIILGILAAVVVFAVNGITDEGEINSCKTEGRTVKTAVEAYNAQNNEYPANMGELVAAGSFLESQPTWWDLGAARTGEVRRINTDTSQENGVTVEDCPVNGS